MKKILVIDDEEDFLEWVKTGLSAEKFEVVTAENGKTGLKLAATQKPDLVIVDLYLPDIEGFDICNQLKSNPDTKHIPVILVTGVFKNIDAIDKGYQNGADDFLIKPFSYEQLRVRVLRQFRR
jgi:DNA-binding response OmpR family regulator